MKEIMEIRDAIQDKIKGLCGEITPGKRLVFFLTVILAFAAVNLYITFSSIYNLGKKSAQSGVIKTGHIKTLNPEQPGVGPQPGNETTDNEEK